MSACFIQLVLSLILSVFLLVIRSPLGFYFFYDAPTDGCLVPFFCSLQLVLVLAKQEEHSPLPRISRY